MIHVAIDAHFLIAAFLCMSHNQTYKAVFHTGSQWHFTLIGDVIFTTACIQATYTITGIKSDKFYVVD